MPRFLWIGVRLILVLSIEISGKAAVRLCFLDMLVVEIKRYLVLSGLKVRSSC